MTSAASRNSLSGSLSRSPRGFCGRVRLPRALTLLELLLALSIVIALFGVVVLNVPAWAESQRLEEGAYRFESMLGMARAEAANLGRKLRLDFQTAEEGTTRIRVLWESDPLSAPEYFSEYSACTWLHHVPTGLVKVARSELIGSSAYRLLEKNIMEDAGASEVPLAAVTFYPDGSCDSAVIELLSTSASDKRVALIEVDGLTGTISSRITTPAELADERQE